MSEVASKAADWLDAAAAARLERRLERGLKQARSSGSALLVSVTSGCEKAEDPTALVVHSRRGGEAWFCLEQPDRQGSAIAALGCVRALEADGAERFATIAKKWQAIAGAALADPPERAPGSGLVALGGFAFAPQGSSSPRWNGFPPASLTVPELCLARHAGKSWLTVTVEITPDDSPEGVLERVHRRLGELRTAVPAAARSGTRGGLRGRQHDAALTLRGGGRACGGADPGGRTGEGRAGARGRGPRPDRP